MWNEAEPGQTRYILGGGWGDPPYAAYEPDARSPFDRSAQNGVRLARYGEDQALDAFLGPIDLPSRDYATETPVSDEVFEAATNGVSSALSS